MGRGIETLAQMVCEYKPLPRHLIFMCHKWTQRGALLFGQCPIKHGAMYPVVCTKLNIKIMKYNLTMFFANLSVGLDFSFKKCGRDGRSEIQLLSDPKVTVNSSSRD